MNLARRSGYGFREIKSQVVEKPKKSALPLSPIQCTRERTDCHLLPANTPDPNIPPPSI